MIEGSLFISLIVILILIVVSAFFSGSETGLTGVSRAKIHSLANEGNHKAKKVTILRRDKDKLISTILLGNNAVNIAASAIATSLAIHYFGDKGVLYVTVVMTLLVLVFAEMLPKTYAFKNTEKIALLVAPIFIPLIKIFSPITSALQIFVDFIAKVFGLHGHNEEFSSKEALRGAIDLHHAAGVVVKDDRDMLGSILDLQETDVEEVMIHRKQMETIDSSKPPKEIINHVLNSPYTRIPLWKDKSDNIVGVLHAKDLLRVIDSKDRELKKSDIQMILSEPWFVPSQTSLKDQLHAFMSRKSHFALVVDEYGDLQGLVTLEDILEEIVGQIEDEYDEQQNNLPEIYKESDGSIIVKGTLTVRDLNREMDWEMPDDEAVTIAGLVIHEAKNIPEKSQVFKFHGFRFEILEKKRNQITKLKIKQIDDKPIDFD